MYSTVPINSLSAGFSPSQLTHTVSNCNQHRSSSFYMNKLYLFINLLNIMCTISYQPGQLNANLSVSHFKDILFKFYMQTSYLYRKWLTSDSLVNPMTAGNSYFLSQCSFTQHLTCIQKVPSLSLC